MVAVESKVLAQKAVRSLKVYLDSQIINYDKGVFRPKLEVKLGNL